MRFKRNPGAISRQKGNFKLKTPAFDIAYGADCVKRIRYLFGSNNHQDFKRREKELLSLIKDRLSPISSFSYKDFNLAGCIRLDSESSADEFDKKIQESIHFLNGLLLLITTVEVLVRLYQKKNGDLFQYKFNRYRK